MNDGTTPERAESRNRLAAYIFCGTFFVLFLLVFIPALYLRDRAFLSSAVVHDKISFDWNTFSYSSELGAVYTIPRYVYQHRQPYYIILSGRPTFASWIGVSDEFFNLVSPADPYLPLKQAYEEGRR